jgi:hypothetical protein
MTPRYVLVDEEFQRQVMSKLNQLVESISGIHPQQVVEKTDDLLDTADAMAYLKVCRRTLFKYRSKMGLPFKQLENGKIYYWRHQIEEFLRKNSF